MSEKSETPQVVEKKRRRMYDFKVAISYESDIHPVVTVRETFTAGSVKAATNRAARIANKQRPRGRVFRSWVIVVENISEKETAAQEE